LLAVARNGIDFTALDGGPVHFLFLIVCPRNSAGKHLLTLAMVAKLLRDRFVRDSILKAESPEKVIQIFYREKTRDETPTARMPQIQQPGHASCGTTPTAGRKGED